MVIRRRLGGAICLLPFIMFLSLGFMFNSQLIIDFSFILMIIGIIFSEKIYNFFLLDSNSTSSLYAGNMALQYGYTPKSQDNKIWNPSDYTISEIYNLYPEKRTNMPEKGSAGFIFYMYKRGKYANKIEFYDYRLGGDFFIDYEFYFHPFDDKGDKTIRKEMYISEITSTMVFVPLEKL